MPVANETQGKTALDRLLNRIDRWEKIRARIEFLLDNPDPMGSAIQDELANLRENRADLVEGIQRLVALNPRLRDKAVKAGFREDLLSGGGETVIGGEPKEGVYPGEEGTGGGGQQGGGSQGGGGSSGGTGGSGGGGGEGDQDFRRKAQDNRLLGTQGKDYDIVRGPGGMYVARYKFRVGGEVFDIGVKLGKDPDKISKYGVKPGDAKDVTAAQLKKIKNIGWADWLTKQFRQGDKHVMDGFLRHLRQQYPEGTGLLQNAEVMSKIIARNLFGWDNETFDSQIRNTNWYRNTNEYQRQWATITSPKEKRDRTQLALADVTNLLEDTYGLDWVKHVDGGMAKAREWAEMVASGRWGAPDEGLAFLGNRESNKAEKIEGTNAWILQQQEAEERRAYLNRPEDKAEELRQLTLSYLGPGPDGKPLIPMDALKGWATDIVTERKSEADFMQFLRNQMKNLYPYFDPNTPWQDQAAPYKAVYENLMNDVIDWSDPLLRNLGGEEGKAMSLHEYELMLRDPNRNPKAWNEGTKLHSEGLNVIRTLEQVFAGVS